MSGAAVTVVLATYNRPDALRVAMRSVVGQSIEDWRLVVVGDHCDAATGEAVRAVDDPRVRYVNLPVRFGEQGGPNWIGTELAETPFVAFLNHDDVLLADHLEHALRRLRDAPGDLYCARSLRARRSLEAPGGGAVPLFVEASAPDRKAAEIFHRHYMMFEPLSAVVVRTALARSIGPWRSARDLHRPPAQDWLLRAWRAGARFEFGDLPTVLAVNTHYQYRTADGCYAASSREHAWVEALLETRCAAEVRDLLLRTVEPLMDQRAWWPAGFVSGHRQRLLYRSLVNDLTARLYRATGADSLDLYCRLCGYARGRHFRDRIRLRTGGEVPPARDPHEVLAAVAFEHGSPRPTPAPAPTSPFR